MIKLKKPIINITLICLLIISCNCFAAIKVDGTVMAEIIYDALNFDPNKNRTSPWRSEDEGGIIKPGFYPGDFTKFGIGIKVFDLMDERVEAYIPLTFTIKSVPINNKSWWQTFLLTEDFLNIPYYLWMQTTPLTYSLSSKPVGDPRFGFLNLKDPLGVGWSLNSQQPLATLKVGGKLAENVNATGYILFDQPVYGIPLVEMLPMGASEIGNQVIDFGDGTHKLVSEIGFIDEQAQYSILQLKRKLSSGLDLGFLWSQKTVDSPSFRLYGIEADDSKAITLKNWGYLKQNIGVDLKGQLTPIMEIGLAAVASNVAWRKYDSVPTIDDQPFFRKRWYPYTVLGELNGNAAILETKFNFDTTKLKINGIVVDPTFQTVAGEYSQFRKLIRVVPDNNQGGLERQSRFIYDPDGKITGQEPKGSPVLDFLGKRVLRFEIIQPGRFATFPIDLVIGGSHISSLEGLESNYVDSLTGAHKIKDYNEMQAGIIYEANGKAIAFSGFTRKYLADVDCKDYLGISFNTVKKNLSLSGTIDNTWRLRVDDGKGRGETFRVSLDLGNTSNKIGLDYRTGNYDYDLLSYNSDRVVEPYTYLTLNAFLQRHKNFYYRGNEGKVLLAGELISRNTDLTDVETGLSQIGYGEINIPISDKLSIKQMVLGVAGPQFSSLPSGHLRTTFHQELVFKPYFETTMRLGYTRRPSQEQKKNNVYFVLGGILGSGNFSITVGQGTLAQFTDSNINLPGSLNLDDKYGVGYPPAFELRGHPWSSWDNDNLYAIWNGSLRSTEETWDNYCILRYWFNF